MRRCLVCWVPLPRGHVGVKHEGCRESTPPRSFPAKPQQEYRPRRRKKESMGAQILRVAQELAGAAWEGADSAQRLAWKRQAKYLIVAPHVP